MPRLIVTSVAVSDMERCRRFLSAKSPAASARAMQAIRQALSALVDHPEVGRPVSTLAGFRELIIDFGDSGYVARYKYLPDEEAIYILALWHQREAGF